MNARITTLDERSRELEMRRMAYQLAGATGLNHRTCRRALELGAGALHRVADQVLVEDVARQLGIELPRGGR